MSIYSRYILPRVIDCACGMGKLRRLRAGLFPQASGVVLEPGFGSGLNLEFYDAKRVSKVIAVEPSAEILELGRARIAAAGFPVEERVADGEQRMGEDASADTAVLSFTLCTVADPSRVLDNIRAALKPGGRLLFCEHGAAPDPDVRRWQDRLNGIWGRLAGGCHLNRDPRALIEAAGFRIDNVTQAYVPDAPRFAAYVTSGVALSC